MSLTVEIPTIVIDSGAAAAAITLIGAAFSGVVMMVDYAFDRVKEKSKE